MSFRFEHPGRSVEDNVRGVVKAEFDRAIAEVGESGFEVHETIRGVRRRLKRVRAVLKLIRPAFPGYVAENAVLRDMGAEVAGLRDAAAVVDGADRLLSRGRAAGEEIAALERVRRALADRAAALDGGLDREAFLTRLRMALREARVRSELWDIDKGGRAAIVPGFVATYAAGRRGFKTVEARRREENFHEWRKAVKHHWIQLTLLRGLMPSFAEPRRAQAKKLAEVLGDLQNFSMLRQGLAADGVGLSKGDKSVVRRLVDKGIERLSTKALKLGRPLFEERPSEVERRWDAYWHEWKAAKRLL